MYLSEHNVSKYIFAYCFIATILGLILTSKLALWCLRTSPPITDYLLIELVVKCLSSPIDSRPSLWGGECKRICLPGSPPYFQHLAHS